MIGLTYPDINYNNIISKLINNNNDKLVEKIIYPLIEFMKQLEVKLIYLEKEINITRLFSYYTARKIFLDNKRVKYDDDNILELHNIISWMVIHQSSQLMGIASDKYLVCKYAQIKLGENLCPQRIGVFDSFEEINFDKILEKGNIMLKISNGCYDKVAIYNNTSKEKIEEIKKKFKKSYERDFGIKGAEFFHLYAKKRIVLEKIFLPLKDLFEFKFFILNHNIVMIFLSVQTGNKKDNYYDSDFKSLPEAPNSLDLSIFDKNLLNKLKNYAIKLSEDFPNFIRVDLYAFHNQVYLSELTFDSTNGDPYKSNFKVIQEAGKNWKRIEI